MVNMMILDVEIKVMFLGKLLFLGRNIKYVYIAGILECIKFRNVGDTGIQEMHE